MTYTIRQLAEQCGLTPDAVRWYVRNQQLRADHSANPRGGGFVYAIPQNAATQFIQWHSERRAGVQWQDRHLVTAGELAERLCLTEPSVRYHFRRANFKHPIRRNSGQMWRTLLTQEEAEEFCRWYLSAERERGARFPSLNNND